MECPKCKAQNPDDSVFCSLCFEAFDSFAAIGMDKQFYLNAKAVPEGDLASKVNETPPILRLFLLFDCKPVIPSG